ACTLRGGCRTKEHDIRRPGGSHGTHRTTVDPGSSNAREECAIECPIARQASAVAYVPIETRRQSPPAAKEPMVRRLSAGGRWIRTIGPCREGAGFCCGRRIGGNQKNLWGTDSSNPSPSSRGSVSLAPPL